MSVIPYLLRTAPAAAAAVEIAPDRVVGAVIAARAGRPGLSAYAVEPLPAGVVVPSLTHRNVEDRAALSMALGRVLERLGRPRRVGLLLPDPVAKVSVLHFDRPPDRAEDLDHLIRFQMRKAAPFAIDDAQVCWLPGTSNGSERDYIVSMARRDVVEEYESFCTAAGAHPGIVDLATFNVANAVLAEQARSGDWLLVNAAGAYVSIAIFRGSHLVFFRSRTADADDSIADMVHQTAMYYEDRLDGRGFARVMLRGNATESGNDRIRESLEARLSVDVHSIDPRGAVGSSESLDAPATHLDALAPVVGLLVRGRAAA